MTLISCCRLEEKEKMSMMLEAEKKQAAEQAKMLEMDLEVHGDTLRLSSYSHLLDCFKRKRKNTPAS